MPKLPVFSGTDVVRALERLGFVNSRQRGSHIVMRRGGFRLRFAQPQGGKNGNIGWPSQTGWHFPRGIH
ncbi:MAG: type II toxin-antitoxin system HicA family toxin [Desulfococcaceae bacterium]